MNGTPQVGLIEAVKLFFQNYTNFSGRSRRSEYWMVYLASLLFGIAAGIVIAVFSAISSILGIFIYVILLLFILAIAVPSISLGVRRLHDIGKSGWFYLINFIPYVGQIILIVMFALDSQPGSNQWGDSPKYPSVRTAPNFTNGDNFFSSEPPRQSTYPQQPGQPTYPQQPGQPTYPRQPGQPTYPQQPVQPTYPQQPVQPTYPQQPGQPTYPQQPVQPTYPQQPGQPTYPQQPGQPQPTQPQQTDNNSNQQ